MSLLAMLFGRKATDGRSPAAAAELVKAGAFLLDVRSPGEFGGARIAGARNIPLGQLAQRAGEIPRDRTVVVLCHSGGRSRAAIGRLKALGFTDLANLNGGLAAWEAAGLPVAR